MNHSWIATERKTTTHEQLQKEKRPLMNSYRYTTGRYSTAPFAYWSSAVHLWHILFSSIEGLFFIVACVVTTGYISGKWAIDSVRTSSSSQKELPLTNGSNKKNGHSWTAIKQESLINRVFAIYQIMLGWKAHEYYYEIDEPPNPRPIQPKKKKFKVAFAPLIPHSKQLFVGWDRFYMQNRLHKS